MFLLLSVPAWWHHPPYRSHIRQVMLNRYPASRLSMTAFHLKQRSAEVVSSISPCLFSALVNAYRIKLRELQVYRMLFDMSLLNGTTQSVHAYYTSKTLSKPLRPHDASSDIIRGQGNYRPPSLSMVVTPFCRAVC